MLRLAIANIHRPGALTPSVVLSLGLGLAAARRPSPRSTATCAGSSPAALPEQAPSFFFIDIPSTQAAASTTSCARWRRARRSRTCRCCAAASSPRAASAPRTSSRRPNSEWVLQSDRGLTYTGELPKGSKVVEGEWWGADYPARRWSRSRRRSPTASASRSATRSSSTCSAATSRRRSAICAPSTGRGSASISCWCSRRTPSRARRTPTSPR